MPAYDSLPQAVYYAAQAAREIGGSDEVATLIYYLDGKYHFEPPKNDKRASSGKRDDKFRATFSFPKGAKPVQTVHNHPVGAENRFFSSDDVDVAGKLGLPSAIVYDGDDGKPVIRTFTPGKTRLRKDPARGRHSEGDEFAWSPDAEVVATSGAHNTLVK
jgi:hypothetical protein